MIHDEPLARAYAIRLIDGTIALPIRAQLARQLHGTHLGLIVGNIMERMLK